MKNMILLIIILFLGGFTDPYGVKEIKEGIIYFNNNESFDTNLFNLEFIGQIKVENEKPYLILSGTDCLYCDENPTIRILKPNEDLKDQPLLQERYSYPGKIYYWENNELIYESRTFFGEVLTNRKGIIWIQRELTDQNDWVKSTFFLEVADDTVIENRKDVDIQEVLTQVDLGKAVEITGKSYTSEP